MKPLVYYSKYSDTLLIYLGKSVMPNFKRFQFKENGYFSSPMKLRGLTLLGEL